MWFGFLWAFCAVGVVMFFNTMFWWEPLASRYTYSVRVGVSLIIAALLVDLLKRAKYLRVIQGLFWVLVIVTVWQTFIMLHIVKTEYSYVYTTGRTLVKVVQEIADMQPRRVIIEWERPFERNKAHVVGLLYYLAQIPENRIIFLSAQERIKPGQNEVVLHWDMEKEQYEIIRGG